MLNRAELIGRLGRDPEIRFTGDGAPVARLAVATNETWRDGQGAKQERTEWHRVVLFAKLAEIAREHLAKGALVYLEGRLQTRKWAGQDGVDRYATEIVADTLRMLGPAPTDRSGPASAQAADSDLSTLAADDIPF
jgi:single-strand DNA-binding protein